MIQFPYLKCYRFGDGGLERVDLDVEPSLIILLVRASSRQLPIQISFATTLSDVDVVVRSPILV
ncbi:hypothetical protein SAY87_010018 [Trapa incisa]|uniref:Uncharacterized protein n=2 Tax=Trapa TaxID=22665 RepID=A0AAN7LXU4_TRANT|nr:hypothetical protein SAY87_010018 [Trapa incisa]KAK4794547.1 hypothetical protein SAY86_012541 [Trapa natans]